MGTFIKEIYRDGALKKFGQKKSTPIQGSYIGGLVQPAATLIL